VTSSHTQKTNLWLFLNNARSLGTDYMTRLMEESIVKYHHLLSIKMLYSEPKY